MKRLLVLCGLAALLVAPVAHANHSQPLAFFTSHASLSQTISQQPGAINPTLFGDLCVWDVNDYMQRDAVLNSALASGVSVSDSLCVYADWTAHTLRSEIAADSPNMVLRLSVSTGGSYIVTPAVFDKRLGLWMYRTCLNVPTYQSGDPLLQSIAGSNGGVAVPTTVTLAASNPSSKQIAKIRYNWGIFAGTC